MMIDSLDMDDAGRAAIVARCRTAAECAIVVTHGTDTMVETARALAAADLRDKTIVLTGAMVPYAFGSSDGLFNLGSALSFVQVLPPGVYVAMNGRHFSWDRVRKNRTTGVFELVEP
jgi:L-asparaginase